jgi:hypothetical protein
LEMNNREWLFANDRRRPDSKQVKIAESIYVIQKMLKTPGGLIRITAVSQNGKLQDVHISGDFFFFPSSSLVDLERTLENVPVDATFINQVVAKFYEQKAIESPGVVPSDFGQILAD